MTKVKICGITNLEDAFVAVEAGADLLGFIFYEPSPRYVQPEVVREIVSGVRGQGSGTGGQGSGVGGQVERSTFNVQTFNTFVGVFVNSPLDTVAHLLDFCRLDAAQLHGEESPEFVRHFQGRAYKALRPQSPEEAETLIQYYHPSTLPPFHPSTLPPFHP
ncbi:MAG: phosphoribosylanthranilate isomerase, partial [Anaerolineales bacterium]|nr:phosphoribosylanthranilate isomerase [Anaerolineales bacterium]